MWSQFRFTEMKSENTKWSETVEIEKYLKSSSEKRQHWKLQMPNKKPEESVKTLNRKDHSVMRNNGDQNFHTFWKASSDVCIHKWWD